jgi:thioredoxin reductase (NADPH)
VSRCVIVASGASYRTLDVPNRQRFEGAGVYYAATEMESRLCGGDEVVVVGGGNSAGQATMYLSRVARRVHVVIRGDDLGKSMSRYLVDRVEGTANVTVHRSHDVAALDGGSALERVVLRDVHTGTETALPARALFLFIGAVPHSAWLRDCVSLDRHGFVVTGPSLAADLAQSPQWQQAGRAPFFLETSLPGIFAVGDIRSGSVKRVASAVGEGSMAVSLVHAHIGAVV